MQLSGSKKRPYSAALGAMELNLRGDVAEGSHSSSAAAGTTEGALCRPWDRGDFMRRLATFKSISWFAKPKVVFSYPSSVCFVFLFSKPILFSFNIRFQA